MTASSISSHHLTRRLFDASAIEEMSTLEKFLNTGRPLTLDEEGKLSVVSRISYLWRSLKSVFIGSDQAFSDCKVYPITLRVEKLFEDHKDQLHRGQQLIIQNVLEVLPKRALKDEAVAKVHEIRARIFDEVTIKPRLRLVNHSIEDLKRRLWWWKSLEYQDAIKFLEDAKGKLLRGEAACLPRWYHATRDLSRVEGILSKQTIQKNLAVKGYGAYVSSNDEAGERIGYGPFTLALDGDCIENFKGAFFIPNPEQHLFGRLVNWICGWPRASIWVRVEENIPVNRKTVAFLIADDQRLPELRQVVKKMQLDVPCVSRKVSRVISEALANADSKAEMPHRWRWMPGMSRCSLPKPFAS